MLTTEIISIDETRFGLRIKDGDTEMAVLSEPVSLEAVAAVVLRLQRQRNQDFAPSDYCALIAHDMGVEAWKRAQSAPSSLDRRANEAEARRCDKVSLYFASGHQIYPIKSPGGKIVSYVLDNGHGDAYALDRTGTHCTCEAGRKSRGAAECWHSVATQIFIEATKNVQTIE